MKDWWFMLPAGAYVAAVIGSLIVARKLRPTRWPFKEEERLLRGPGESLRKEIARLDEAFLFELLGGIFAVLLAPVSAAMLARWLGTGSTGMLFGSITAFVVVTIWSAWRVIRLWWKRQAYHLGWFGERLVAQKLAPLKASGWRVFHDVPFVNNGKPFNIDHVVVGTGGLFVIETKTRRMGGGRNGETDHEVCFDGQALHWPRYKNDESGLLQAERNAATLGAWIEQEIGMRVPAMPILVIPAWSVKLAGKLGHRPCRVDSANWIQNTFKDRKPCLPSQTVELIALRLLSKCRDVED